MQEKIRFASRLAGGVRAAAVHDDDLVRPLFAQAAKRVRQVRGFVQGWDDNRYGHGGMV
jgi:hypothetical protein